MVRSLTGWREPARERPVLEDCTLVVPTYQRPGDVLDLLDALDRIPDPPGEVVFVDGSRDERTAEALAARRGAAAHRFDLAYVRSAPGLTRQRNVGIDASTREFVFYLDDDCRPEPGYFRGIRDAFRQDASGKLGAVCGSIVNEMGKPMSLRWKLRMFLGLVPRRLASGRYDETATSVPRATVAPFQGLRDVDMVPGGAVAYRRSVLQESRFSLFFDGYAQGEDLEMSLRIGRHWRLAWCGDAHVNHFHAAGGRPDSFAKGRMEVRNRDFIRRRYRPKRSLLANARFWADIAFVFACDLGYALMKPPRSAHLRHAVGVLAGAFECAVVPPSYQEPKSKTEYSIVWEQSG